MYSGCEITLLYYHNKNSELFLIFSYPLFKPKSIYLPILKKGNWDAFEILDFLRDDLRQHPYLWFE